MCVRTSICTVAREQFSEFLAFYAVMTSSKEELKWRASFALCDTNHNGKLNAKELGAAVARAFVLNSVRKAAPTAAAAAGGEPSILPVRASAAPLRPLSESDQRMVDLQVQQFFGIADKDRNGDITLAEYLDAMRRSGALFENVTAFSCLS